ncbi:hypothetical protein ACFQY0_19845 [Haloferula chungangensis]|uniref:Uncharacterized protein n=1 Tax=Haloferula chungangensis TaxID=1048331 RepID=A0ABW2LFA0_9BACT
MPLRFHLVIFLLISTLCPAIAKDSLGDLVLKKLEGIVIPIIDFQDTTLEEAIDYLRVRSLELDREEAAEMRGVSIIIRKPRKLEADDGLDIHEAARSSRIKKYQRRNISLLKVLTDVCDLTQQDAYITSVGIIICPKDQKPFPNTKGQNGEIWKKLTK